MREYLFRGKRSDNGEWIEGSLIVYDWDNRYVSIYSTEEEMAFQVVPETVGQYTGLTDKNGRKIFEGDIVDVAYNIEYVGVAKHRMGLFKVIFYKGCFMKKAIPNPQMSFYENAERAAMYHFIPSDETEIVGNIYDNPEFLGGETYD